MTDSAPEQPAETPGRDDTDLLGVWLRENDAPCPMCGYNLRRLAGDRCPECGSEVALGLRSPSFLFRWWLLPLLCVSLTTGFSGFMLLAMIASWVIYGGGGNPRGQFFVELALGIAMAIGAGGIVALCRSRVAWARQSAKKQRALGVLTGLAGVIGGCVLIVILFILD